MATYSGTRADDPIERENYEMQKKLNLPILFELKV
jgi:hypothetical protein